jgi:hypothetical protein
VSADFGTAAFDALLEILSERGDHPAEKGRGGLSVGGRVARQGSNDKRF